MWPACGSSVVKRDISKKMPKNTTLDTNSNPITLTPPPPLPISTEVKRSLVNDKRPSERIVDTTDER